MHVRSLVTTTLWDDWDTRPHMRSDDLTDKIPQRDLSLGGNLINSMQVKPEYTTQHSEPCRTADSIT